MTDLTRLRGMRAAVARVLGALVRDELLVTAMALAAAGRPADARAQPRREAAGPTRALTHVTIIDPATGAEWKDYTVVLRGERIAAVGPAARTRVPAGAAVVPLPGRVVVPGFVDMHYHVITAAMRYRRTAAGALDSTYDRALAERLLRVALAFGITTIRDPGASPLEAALALRDDVRHGRIVGPDIYTAGPIINHPAMSDSAIRAEVRAQADAGVDFVKVYSALSDSQVAAAVDEAHRRGLRVIGHLQRASWTSAARAGIDFITHGANWHERYLPDSLRPAFRAITDMRQRIAWYEGIDLESPAVDTLVRELVSHRVSIDPTLVAYHTKFWWRDSIYQRDPDVAVVPEELENWRTIGMHTAGWSREDFDRVQAVWWKQLAFVRLLQERGVLLTAGSDVASPWVIPGVSFHQELVLLASAGLPSLDVLRIATTNGAQALGIAPEVGRIEPGARADLVVLRASPAADIRNTRTIEYVIKRGTVWRPASLLGRSRERRAPPR